MKLEQFAMERMQSTWENLVDYNLSESGVHPLTPRELLGSAGSDVVFDQPLVYTQSNGTAALRALIASLYTASPDHIQVTNGGSEANYVAVWRLIEPGDEVAMLVPNYMQTWGLVRAFGGTVREWPLIEDREARRWRPDLDAARARCVRPHPSHRHLHAEQPDRRTADSRRAGRDRCDSGPPRRVDSFR